MRKIPSNLIQAVDFEKSKHGLNCADIGNFRSDGQETASPPIAPSHTIAKRPYTEEKFNMLKQRSPQISNNPQPIHPRSPNQGGKTSPEEILTDNLLKHLNVGSRDCLKLMIGIFDYHHFDKALLDAYIKNKSPENLKALEIQITRFAAATSAAKPR